MKHYKLLDATIDMDLREIKSLYYKKALECHPDRPGGNEALMKEITGAWEYIRANHGSLSDSERAHIKYDIEPAILAKAVKIANLNGLLEVAVAGAWIWVTGPVIKGSEEIRTTLKSEGFKFSRKKLAWYYAGCKSASRGRYSLGQIFDTYGRTDIERRNDHQLPA